MRLSEFDYVLPLERIAQEPLAERDKSRLLVLHRDSGRIEHRTFLDILEYLSPGDIAVFNDTRVTATRLRGRKETGGAVEALLLRRLDASHWEALIKPGRRVHVGVKVLFDQGLEADVVERTPDGGRILEIRPADKAEEVIARIGETPLPPYITQQLVDGERYQTVYARADGSYAAPTAGLHFTPELIGKLEEKGVRTAFITLHVGIGTFRPVRTENVLEHEMHSEFIEVAAKTAKAISEAPGRVVAIGTTTARALESAATGKRAVAEFRGETRLFIKPGYEFRVVDRLVTNFHLPKSTLLILVSTFAGTNLVREAYNEAVAQRYRFLSFGDAMLII